MGLRISVTPYWLFQLMLDLHLFQYFNILLILGGAVWLVWLMVDINRYTQMITKYCKEDSGKTIINVKNALFLIFEFFRWADKLQARGSWWRAADQHPNYNSTKKASPILLLLQGSSLWVVLSQGWSHIFLFGTHHPHLVELGKTSDYYFKLT